MALTISRIDRIVRSYNVVATLGTGVPDVISGIEVALLPPRVAPDINTAWTAAQYASGTATVLYAGPDADETGAIVVPTGGADVWMRVIDSPEVQAVKVERITVLGSGGTVTPPQGETALTQSGADARYVQIGDPRLTDARTPTAHTHPEIQNAITSTVPTLEELERVALLGTVNATATRRLGATNFPQRIGGLVLASGTAVTTSDTDYWTVQVQRRRSGHAPLVIATRTTRATGGEPVVADQGWNFDSVQWLETARHLQKGDVLALSFTKTGTPGDLTDLTATIRYEPNVQPVIRDTFTRPNSTTSVGVTDTGQTWRNLAGVLGITDQQIYAQSLAAGYAYADFDTGRSDYTLSAVITAVGGASYGLVFRCIDYDNIWEFAASGLWVTFNGAVANVAPVAVNAAPGDVLSVVLSGTRIEAYKNGVMLTSTTDSRLQNATRAGLYIGGGATRWDNLELAV